MWLSIDERSDVLASLSLCQNCLADVAAEPANWKWAILSLHNGLQGAMVCHLSGTAQLGALDKKSVAEWLEWHERDRRGEIKRILQGTDELGMPEFRFATRDDQPPRERLADAKELFRRLYNAKKRCEPGAGAILTINGEQLRSFVRLHHLRNGFAHFTPKGWSIELSGLPKMFRDLVEVIELISRDPWTFRHMEGQEQQRLVLLLEGIKARVK